MEPLDSRLALVFEEVAKARAELETVTEKLRAVSGTATSKNRAVTATVDAAGELTELKFNSMAFRSMAPKELSHLLLDVIAKARQDARTKISEATGAVTGPAATSAQDLLSGKADITSILPSTLPTSPEDMLKFLRGEWAPADPTE